MTLSLEQRLDPGTAAIINSHLAWLDGRLTEADTQLDTAATVLGSDHPVVVNEQIRRRALTGQWLQASQLIYQHRVRGQGMPNPDSSVLWASLLHVDDQALRRASASPGDTEWQLARQAPGTPRRKRSTGKFARLAHDPATAADCRAITLKWPA
jgi:hypothetical protein